MADDLQNAQPEQSEQTQQTSREENWLAAFMLAVIFAGAIGLFWANIEGAKNDQVRESMRATAVMAEQRCDNGKVCVEVPTVPLPLAEPGKTYGSTLTIVNKTDEIVPADVAIRSQLVNITESDELRIVREDMHKFQAGFIEPQTTSEVPFTVTIPDVPEGMEGDDNLTGAFMVFVVEGALPA